MTEQIVETTEVESVETQKEPMVGKELIYAEIGDMVKEMTGKRVGKTGGRKIFDAVVEKIFAEATKAGTFRFNAGFGSLHIKNYQAGSRRLPSGQETTFGERQKLRYEEGVVVSALVESKGDLAAVLAARKASGESDVDAAPAAAEGEVELN